MKLYAVVTVVVGGFATLGFAAGAMVSGSGPETDGTAAQKAAVEEMTAPDLAQPMIETPEMAILNAAEARKTAAAQTPAAQVTKTAKQRAAGPHLIKLANVTQPVRKSASVSFVVADVAVSLRDAQSAAHYEIPQNAARLQAAIEQAMASAADTPILRGVNIDSHQLSGKLTQDLQADFSDVEDVLFLTLYKHDVAYN